MNQNDELQIPEWHNIADVAVQRICDNSIVNLTLYVKLINGERFYKVNGEHVRMLPEVEYVNGFCYNAGCFRRRNGSCISTRGRISIYLYVSNY